MNTLLIALFAGVLAFGSAPALADDSDMKPLSKMDAREAKAARDAAKAKWASMTPEEQRATKAAAAKKKRSQLTALEEIGNNGIVYDTEQGVATTPSGTPLIGDFGRPRTPEEREAAAKKAADAAEKRQSELQRGPKMPPEEKDPAK